MRHFRRLIGSGYSSWGGLFRFNALFFSPNQANTSGLAFADASAMQSTKFHGHPFARAH